MESDPMEIVRKTQKFVPTAAARRASQHVTRTLQGYVRASRVRPTAPPNRVRPTASAQPRPPNRVRTAQGNVW